MNSYCEYLKIVYNDCKSILIELLEYDLYNGNKWSEYD